MTQQYLYIPDVMATWPWARKIHPLHEEVTAESRAWLGTFKPFTPESLEAFHQCNVEGLAALAYPDVPREHLRVGMDLMNLFFVIDEYTDVESAEDVKEMIDIVIDAVHNPQKPRPAGEIILGEMTRQWAEGLFRAATPLATSHFLSYFTDYLLSVVSQSEDRCGGNILSISDYIKIRGDNHGGRPSFCPSEFQLSIPDEVYFHPHIVELRTCIVDMITVINDILSYNREQATDNDDYNLVTVVMHEINTDFDGALAWIVDFHNDVARRFMKGLENVPSFGAAIDAQLQQYLLSTANWPRAVDCWSFESKRYFGTKGLIYQKTRIVPLLPKKKPDLELELRREQVEVYLVECLSQPIIAKGEEEVLVMRGRQVVHSL